MLQLLSITDSPAKPGDCTIGWMTHYFIGTGFAFVFVSLVSSRWVERPTLLPAFAFGIATVLLPFFTMQPAFGLGVAASKTPNPATARLKSLTTHTMFGVGLYVGVQLLASFTP